MWSLYIFMSLLTAGITIKIVHPLIGRGRHRHADALTAADRKLALALVVILPCAALGLYQMLGRPDLPGTPRMITDYQSLETDHNSLLAQRPMETLLTKDPDDIGALMTLAQINANLEKPKAAVPYLKHALEVAQKNPDEWRTHLIATSLVDMQAEASGGVMDADVMAAVEKLEAISPGGPIARYYRALYKAQNGDVDAAMREWTDLLNEGRGDTYWKKRLRAKMAEVLAAQKKAKPAQP